MQIIAEFRNNELGGDVFSDGVIGRDALEAGDSSFFSTIQVFNPAHRLHIGNLAKIPLRGRRMSMPHNHPF